MRIVVGAFVGILGMGIVAHVGGGGLVATAQAAPNYELNSIKGSVKSAEDRLNAKNYSSARYFVDSAKGSMEKASAATKADPEFAKLKAKLAEVEKKLIPLEKGAAGAKAADDLIGQASMTLATAKSYASSDDHERAVAEYKRCLAQLGEAFAADPSARTRPTVPQPNRTGADFEKECKEGAAAAGKMASGEGLERAASREEGKLAAAGYDAALKIFEKKSIVAEELVAGLKAVEECRNGVGRLTGLMNRRGNPYWDPQKETLPTARGPVTLAAIAAKCQEIQKDFIYERKAKGCGKKSVTVQQTLIARKTWSSVGATSATHFEIVPCGSMPKKSKFPGLAAKYRGMIEKQCGKKAIYVIDNGSWRTGQFTSGQGFRSLDGHCYDKGELSFRK